MNADDLYIPQSLHWVNFKEYRSARLDFISHGSPADKERMLSALDYGPSEDHRDSVGQYWWQANHQVLDRMLSVVPTIKLDT
jgi:hypothetical protein